MRLPVALHHNMTQVLLQWRCRAEMEMITATELGHRGQGVRPLQWIMPLMCTTDCGSDQCGFQGSDLTVVPFPSLLSVPHVRWHVNQCWGPRFTTWSMNRFHGGLTNNYISACWCNSLKMWISCVKGSRPKLLSLPFRKALVWNHLFKRFADSNFGVWTWPDRHNFTNLYLWNYQKNLNS